MSPIAHTNQAFEPDDMRKSTTEVENLDSRKRKSTCKLIIIDQAN